MLHLGLTLSNIYAFYARNQCRGYQKVRTLFIKSKIEKSMKIWTFLKHHIIRQHNKLKLLQQKDIFLIHKSASVSALPVFKLSSIRISIRITSIRISIANKHFLINIHGHTSLAFIALLHLHICMLISFFKEVCFSHPKI